MSVIRIIPRDHEDGAVATKGTQVFCGDQKISGVTRIELVAEVNDVWRARIDCFVQPPADLMAESIVHYPRKSLLAHLMEWWNARVAESPVHGS